MNTVLLALMAVVVVGVRFGHMLNADDRGVRMGEQLLEIAAQQRDSEQQTLEGPPVFLAGTETYF
jgi:hypothetical protein